MTKTYIQQEECWITGKGPSLELYGCTEQIMYGQINEAHEWNELKISVLKQGIAEELIIEDVFVKDYYRNTGAIFYRAKAVILNSRQDPLSAGTNSLWVDWKYLFRSNHSTFIFKSLSRGKSIIERRLWTKIILNRNAPTVKAFYHLLTMSLTSQPSNNQVI